MSDTFHAPGKRASASSASGVPRKAESRTTAPSRLALAMTLLIGVWFGIVLTKSEVARWQRIHDMFLFREAYMYLVMASAIAVAAVSMLVIRRRHVRTIEGKEICYRPKPFHPGVVIGGIVFGAGWAITGSCPGPVYAQIGGGELMALCTLGGALAGMFAYAWLQPRLPH
jgi:uncharacterized membrane protein YedE/YeeE